MKTLTRRAFALGTTLALTAGAALVATTPAQAAVARTHAVTIASNPGKVTTSSTSGGKSFKITATFSGTASDGGYSDKNGDGVGLWYLASYPELKLVSSRVASPNKPYVVNVAKDSNPVPGSKITATIRVSASTSPGVYSVTFPVKQLAYVGSQYVESTKMATAKFTVYANKKVSVSETSLASSYWRAGQTAKLTLRAPDYQRGAKATLYVKKKGKKKYVKHSTKKLREDGYRSSAKFSVKNLRKGDKLYFKVTKAKYAPAYKSTVAKVR
ncbi:hypothetical protein HF995_06570 [Sanguibacter hominis ATCC BAA-789]|uniref:Tat pathway signal sequence domain protein n=1 Tax=Sanguibacter hominis ATCC BAA-789 TaxID=1312740 RepID=A0A9X5IP77_9MICO|nr:hypothetical protein [Sanguibacter hominis]NKX92942.1 hypothetical protein [Sanguibacter hominis ATCC BAA-789]